MTGCTLLAVEPDYDGDASEGRRGTGKFLNQTLEGFLEFIERGRSMVCGETPQFHKDEYPARYIDDSLTCLRNEGLIGH